MYACMLTLLINPTSSPPLYSLTRNSPPHTHTQPAPRGQDYGSRKRHIFWKVCSLVSFYSTYSGKSVRWCLYTSHILDAATILESGRRWVVP